MRRSIVALVASIACIWALPGAATAQLPTCPPGTSNPGYCEPPPSVQDITQTAASAHANAQDAIAVNGSIERLVAGSGVPVSARARTAGKHTITLSVKLGRKMVVLARGSKAVRKAGKTKIVLAATKAGKKYLRGRKSARVKITTVFNPKVGKTVTLTGKAKVN